MKAFTASLLAVIGIGYIAAVVLEGYQATVDKSFVGSGARPDPDPKLLDVQPTPKKG